jgi:arylsulfatase A-like enzyme
MKAIMVMFDSLNRGFLSAYGCQWTQTQNFKRLEGKTITFDNSYAGSLPCMPARRELHTGRYNFLHRSWGPVEPYDDSMPEILQSNGIYTHLISDHQHYWEDGGATYHHRYNSWEIVRGQEGDRWKGQVKDPEIPEYLGNFWRQDAINRSYMKTEEDQPQARVFKLGLEFLEKNKNDDNWFLHLETFDPHEPFFTMEKYKELYPHTYNGPHFDWPSYGKVTEDDEAKTHMRYQYAALLSMCDKWLGEIIGFMDANNMWSDTLLVVNTDHGFLLGEHECWGKSVHPYYNEIAHTPFFLWDPRFKIKGERRRSLVQSIDIAPTLLEYFKLDIPADMQGKSLKEVIQKDISIREGALFGLHGGQINVTDGRYVYMRDSILDNKPLYEYTQMPTHMRDRFSPEEMRTMTLSPPFSFTKDTPLMRIEACSKFRAKGHSLRFGNRLYDLAQDPEQNTIINNSKIESRMIDLMVKLMRDNDCPKEQFIRMGLDGTGNSS